MKKPVYSIAILVIIVVAAFGAILLVKSNKPKHVVLFMIDTLRADHLGVHGYPRNTSPTLDTFARENVMARTAIAVAPWTPPSVASILTGLSVARHGHSPHLRESTAKKQGQLLRTDLETLPEILKKHGYITSGVSSNPWISKEFNFDQGFDSFYYEHRSTTEVTMRDAKRALAVFEENPDKPFFLYVHILDPHGPYQPKGQYASMFTGKVDGAWPYDEEIQDKVNRYDGEIRNVDDHIGKFFELLKSKGFYDDAVIVVVSDHGEQFNERGDVGHGKMLHMEEVHVPFFVKCNDHRQEITDVVSNLDVTPTILGCLKIEPPTGLDGISILDTQATKKRAGAFSSVNRTFVQEAYTTLDGMRLIRSKGRIEEATPDWGVKGAYDLTKDPLEQNPSFDPGTVSELTGYLESARNALTPKEAPKTEAGEVSDESMKNLETLGYINN